MASPGLPEPERRQLDAVVRLLDDILGDAAVGAYLCGSAVRPAGLRADSDLDVVVVASRRTTEVERRSLVDGLLSISRTRGDPTGKRHLEVTVVVEPDIRPWRYPPPMELQYGDWWRNEFEYRRGTAMEIAEPGSGRAPDCGAGTEHPVVRATHRGADRPDPREDLDHAMHEVVPDLVADLEDDTRNVLLTLARVWLTLETGTIGTKDVAADWALARLPDGLGAALRRSRAAYVGGATDVWDDAAMGEARADATAIRHAIEQIQVT